jgi:hypothetical protein
MINNTKLWIESPTVYIMDNGYFNFIPTREMNKTEQINAITLFLLYVLFSSYLFNFNSKWLTIIVISLIIVMVFLHYGYYSKIEPMTKNVDNIDNIDNIDNEVSIRTGSYDSNNQLKLGKFYSHKQNKTEDVDRSFEDMQKYLKATERKPTSDNPMMNPILTDFNTENLPTASNADDDDIKNEISQSFNKDLFRDLNDLYDRKSSDRVFYTVPGGSVPNDQDAFAKWCYNLPATCQEGNGLACIKKYHEDLRYRTSYR